MTDRITESCGCGARWDGPTAYRGEADSFREAHAACRQHHADEAEVATAIRETGQAIAEAILASAEYTEASEHARGLVQELAG